MNIGTRISLFGTGLMGFPMALRLLRAGFEVTVWNRTAAKAEPLARSGAAIAPSPAAAAASAEIAITMLQDAAAVESVLFERGLLAALAPGALLVDMSSIPPAVARAHGERAAAAGHGYLDAPVSGGTRGAERGELAIMVGGDPADLETARPALAALGRPTRVGPVGSGQVTKCVNQAIVGVTIGAVAEGLHLARSRGADPAAVREAIAGGFADSRILREHGLRMVERDFVAGAPVRGQVKDLRTVLEEAGDLELELTRLALSMYERLLASGDEELDHSALLIALERGAEAEPGERRTG